MTPDEINGEELFLEFGETPLKVYGGSRNRQDADEHLYSMGR